MPTARRAEGERLDDVGAAADAGVEDDRRLTGGLDDVGQAVERRQPAVGLPAAVVRAVDAVDAGVDARRASSGWQMPLSSSGRT